MAFARAIIIAATVAGLLRFGLSPASAAAPDVTLAAAGDIACSPTYTVLATRCHEAGTAGLIGRLAPTAVAALGDTQYDAGALSDYMASFDPTWGSFKSLIHPAPGNHEYYTDTSAAGYYTYFGSVASPQETGCTAACKGYYSYDVGSWHIVALNTNNNDCQYVGCQSGSAQLKWLEADLATTSKSCIMAYFHHPRWSSGTHHGSQVAMGDIWSTLYAHGTDLVLNGHEHNYERFAKQSPTARADAARGIREFVVGTGGNGLYGLGTPIANSQVRNSNSKGVLKLTLHADGYDWQFQPAAGYTFTDAGSDTCNA